MEISGMALVAIMGGMTVILAVVGARWIRTDSQVMKAINKGSFKG